MAVNRRDAKGKRFARERASMKPFDLTPQVLDDVARGTHDPCWPLCGRIEQSRNICQRRKSMTVAEPGLWITGRIRADGIPFAWIACGNIYFSIPGSRDRVPEVTLAF